MSSQADGYYPRLNAAIVQSGRYMGMIVSLVGQVEQYQPHGSATFRASDNGTVLLSTAQCDHMPMDNGPDRQIMEVVGSVTGPSTFEVFVVRPLSSDTDLAIYDQMVQMQHNPKYSHYFAPSATPVSPTATN